MSASYTATITVAAAPRAAFDAINDVAGWWGRITGATTAVGDEFVYVVPGLHYSGFRVVDLVPERRVEWLVTGSYLDFVEDKQEWNGTTARFKIEPAGEGSRITFTHQGLESTHECFEICSNAWGMFIRGSLKQFIETGVGAPYQFEADEVLTADDHAELHHGVAQAARAQDANS